MPEIVTCPECDRKLRVPDNLIGKKVKCPGCSVMFTAALGGATARVSKPAPPPEEPIEDPVEERRDAVVRRDDYDDRRSRRRDDDYEDDRPSRRRDDDYYEDDRPSRRRDDDYDDDYRGPSPRALKEGWGKVRTGINLNIIGGWIWVGGAVFMALGLLLGMLFVGSAIFSAFGGGSGRVSQATQNTAEAAAGIGIIITVLIFSLCALAELVLRVTGYGMCMAAPSVRGTSLKPLAIAAFSIAGVEALLRLVGCSWGFFAAPAVGVGPGAGYSTAYSLGQGMGSMVASWDVIGWFVRVIGLAGLIVFLLFARGVAAEVHDKGLPGSLLTLLIVFVVFHVLQWLAALALVLGIIGTGFSALGSSSAAGAANKIGAFAIVAMVLGGLMFIAYLCVEVWYIFVLQRLRDGVQRHIRKLAQE